MDGNFCLQRKNKKDDPDDVALMDGKGYFVETSAYQSYMKKVADMTHVCALFCNYEARLSIWNTS